MQKYTKSEFLDGKVTLYGGDNRDVLRQLPDNSIDSVVTDPPYALVSIVKRFGNANAAPAKGNDAYMRASAGFMGKQWDTGEVAFSEEFWAEVLRVLKPGGHVAAFGASRGYHRMACAIEDAGFEIRDSLMWVYGTGFPKSHNVALSIDKECGAVGHLAKSFNTKGAGDRADEFAANGRDFSIRHEPTTDAARQWEGWGTALKPSHEPITVATKPLTVQQHFAILLDYLTDLLEEQTIWFGLNAHVAERSFSAIRVKLDAVTKPFVLDSAKMRVLANFDPARFADHSSIFQEHGFCVVTKTQDDFVQSPAKQSSSAASYLALTTPHGPADDLSIQLAAMCMSVVTEGISENTVSSWVSISDAILSRANTFTIETASRLTIALRTWNSLTSPNTIDDTGSLFPNVSPIVLARKPLSEGTVAANVLRWGTGALNIDGCRVSTDDVAEVGKPSWGGPMKRLSGAPGQEGKLVPRTPPHNNGRWPANVVHDGSSEVVEAFPNTAPAKAGNRGLQHSGRHGGLADIGGNIKEGTDTVRGHSDNGGSAARFFYSAKASKRDRDEGLDGLLPAVACVGAMRDGGRESQPRKNTHPTVKPTELMRWLARLITPPGGTVLDPFMGSGSTGKAAVYEGFRFIGCEREDEYIKIAEARIAYAVNGPPQVAAAVAAQQPANTTAAPCASARRRCFTGMR